MNAISDTAALDRLERATASLDPPFAVVDLDAFWANAADMERRAAPRPIRLASKSVRCRALQQRVLARPGFRGTLAYTLPEALWLAAQGFEDILVAYPTADRRALRELARLTAERPGARVSIMVDSLAQLDLLDAATPPRAAPVRICLELDAGLWLLGGRVRIGAKRSPVHTPAQAAALARAIVAREGVELVGMMAYEAQIAGLGDAPAGPGAAARLRAGVVRRLQSLSARELAARRGAAVAAVRAVAPLELVNGGGTGSLDGTAREAAVTELAAGSGLYGPGLFDAYRAFSPRPAALFALPVVRRPSRGVATALGGGYLASGPADRARLPRPHLPAGLRLDRQEGAGEVQTPLLGAPADALAVGDRVWMRHAKAGELCERFARLYLIEGDRVVEEVPTYRGEGQCFL
ncbi:MAG TPA: amino acid deaminase/aldolase [Solirubrobacteraceae bacterium]|jgi:D-serine deaminase-like pyridoxal phosphate-dependent protein|nr:amino acid deaminase/aldolase [Solirubrobacteraceae bacterium]